MTSPSSGKLRVGFTAPVTNGSKITGYTAICDSANGGAEVMKSGSKSPIVITGATVGKKYYCIVVAKNGSRHRTEVAGLESARGRVM